MSESHEPITQRAAEWFRCGFCFGGCRDLEPRSGLFEAWRMALSCVWSRRLRRLAKVVR